MSELAAMSDREFADMGITRCDVARVLDPEPKVKQCRTSS